MFEVKHSPLHGRGLFASQFIPQDTILGYLATEPADANELEGPYVLWVDDVTPVRVTCDLRFINHSDEPNAVYYDDLSVVALRDIQIGEEIVHNYMGDEEDDDTEVWFEDQADTVEADETVSAASDELVGA